MQDTKPREKVYNNQKLFMEELTNARRLPFRIFLFGIGIVISYYLF